MLPTNYPKLTSNEYKDVYTAFCARHHSRENAIRQISMFLSASIPKDSGVLRVLAVGPGDGNVELKLLAPYKIQHLIAVEPSTEMVEALDKNLRSSSDFIMKWNIEHTDIESYLQNKGNSEGPFDIILMIHSIYYCSSPGKVMQQLRASLQPKTGQLMVLIALDSFAETVRKFMPEHRHYYGANNVERDLNDSQIPFERYHHPVTTDITDVKGDAKLEWAFASFFMGVNVADGGKDFATRIIEDLSNLAGEIRDGKHLLVCHEDLFIIPATH